jgi:hypothetical protein
MKMRFIILVLSGAIGCATAAPKHYTFSNIPKPEGLVVTVFAAEETVALDGAKREATENCTPTGKEYVVVAGPDTTYNGPDKNGANATANKALSLAAGLLGAKDDRDKSKDYKVQMTVRCEGAPIPPKGAG